jgi:hypothetical protein
MKLIPFKPIALAFLAITFSVCAQTPIISYTFEGNNAQNVANAGTYDGTLGSGVTLGSASGFGVAPTTGAYSYVDSGTFTLSAGYSLTGLGSYVGQFSTASVGGTDANDHIAIGNTVGVTSPFASASGVTFTSWAIQNTTNTAAQTLFYITRATANSVRWQVNLDGGAGTDTYFGNINDQWRNSGLQNNVTGNGMIESGVWTFIATTITYAAGTGGGDLWTTYINGVQVASGTMPGTSTGTYPNETATSGAFIGGQSNGGGAFNGYLDDVSLYNSALSASQIASLYDSYLSPVPEPGIGAILGTGLAGLLFVIRRRK